MYDKDIKHVIKFLRKSTVTSTLRNECMRRASVKVKEGKYKNGKDKFKNYWRCYKCEELFRDVEHMEMDHVVEVDSFKGDWNDFIYNKLYCSVENTKAICVSCHKEKTSAFNARKRFSRKVKR